MRRVYDDAGNTLGYKSSEFAWTTVRQARLDDGTRKIEIFPAEGSYPGMPVQRGYEIRLPITLPPESVRANGANISYASEGAAPGWRYDGDKLTVVISLPRTSVKQKVEVLVKAPVAPAELLDGVPGKLARLRTAMTILGNTWNKGCCLPPDSLTEAAQAGRRITYNPASALDGLRKLEKSMPAIIGEIVKLDVPCNPIIQAVVHLGHGATCDPALKPPPKSPIAGMLLKTAVEKDVAAAVKQYRELKANNANEYDFSEGELERVGYQLLEMKKVGEAIEIFKLNVEAYPQDSDTYDSLGEAYVAHGDKELAAANYKKSLELDPKNTNATAMLTSLTTERKETKVDPKIYDSYAGDYEFSTNFVLTITSEDGKLMGQITGQPKAELFSTSETEFFLKVVDAQITFVRDEQGQVTRLILHQNGRNQLGRRVAK